MSPSPKKRSLDPSSEDPQLPLKLSKIQDEDSSCSSSSSSTSSGDSSSSDGDGEEEVSSVSSASPSLTQLQQQQQLQQLQQLQHIQPENEKEESQQQSSIKELAHMLDSKSEFPYNESSSKALSDDIFDDLMHYDASVAEAITNNHLESNRELIDRQMGLFEEEEEDEEEEGGPQPPLDPPRPPSPPPLPEDSLDHEPSAMGGGPCGRNASQEEKEIPTTPRSLNDCSENGHDAMENPSEAPDVSLDTKPHPNKLLGEADLAHEAISDDDFDDEELDALVNGDVSVQKTEELDEPAIAHEERIKIILDDRSKKNFFEVLPDGWIQVSHSSGMPIYLHRPSRVVSLSKPYFLGKGSVKHHAIPVSSIPCLSYKRGLEEEAETKKRLEAEMKDPDKSKNGCPIFPKARVQSIEEFALNESLNSEQFREFCKGRFIFKELRIKKFNNWTDRRKFQKQVVKKSLKAAIDKTKESLASSDSPSKEVKSPVEDGIKAEGPSNPVKKERPTLPEGTKVLSVPMIELEPLDGNSENASALNQKVVKKSRKEWIINPVGKSMVCILHEYIQQCLKIQPTYRFEEMESSATPYSATVIINGMEYGRGFGTSKKIAKSEAARITIGILIPEIKNSIPSKSQEGEVDAPDLSFFDDIRIEDPRVNELCSRTSEPSPYTILLNCLQRNYGLGDLNITTELRPLRNKKNEFTMRVDKREVKVVCKNKRDGKQLASQKLLQLLHPHVKSWGSLLSLYGNRAARIQKVKKAKESEVTELQSRSSADTAPSIAILEKLRKEMLNLHTARNAMAPIGKFVMPLSSTGQGGCSIERIHL